MSDLVAKKRLEIIRQLVKDCADNMCERGNENEMIDFVKQQLGEDHANELLPSDD